MQAGGFPPFPAVSLGGMERFHRAHPAGLLALLGLFVRGADAFSCPSPAAERAFAARGHRQLRMCDSGLSPTLRRLGKLAADGAERSAVQEALARVTLADFGTAAAGWGRCVRSTRISLKEDAGCSISVLLLPAGERVPPYSRPAADAWGFVALRGTASMRTFSCSDPGAAAALAQGLPEDGLHDPRSTATMTNKNGYISPRVDERTAADRLAEGPGVGDVEGAALADEAPDCVCRGGMCPRRAGCKFWVELKLDRAMRTKVVMRCCLSLCVCVCLRVFACVCVCLRACVCVCTCVCVEPA